MPRTDDELHGWLEGELGLVFPRLAVLAGHSAPFDYLCHSFFEQRRPRDALVWANRGGGKTFLGAVATALDMVFKPGIEIRILAGSLEQSTRMHEHIRHLFQREPLAPLVEGKMTDKRLRLTNGSRVELLAASQASVRGTRVQKLRCDEVDLFDQRIWEAAQLVTRSKVCGDVRVRGAIDCLSTMHVPFGMMSRLVKEAESGHRKLFTWGVVDVLEHCDDSYACDPGPGRACPLLPECAGSAKRRTEPGHIAIDDAIAMKRRVSQQVWNAEMLSLEPKRSDCVYPGFDRRRHVVAAHDPGAPGLVVIAGMDFGFRAPTVVLWASVDPAGVVTVFAERSAKEVVLARHAQAIVDSDWPKPAWVGVDPAGRQRSGQTGQSDIQVLAAQGITVRHRASRIAEGIAMVSARLTPASGKPRLLIHKRCTSLIESLEQYHYPPDRPASMEPVKDGPDHAADALRYMIVNLDHPHSSRHARYTPPG
ncbi:MAG TPA: hypothetical protein ENJ00_10405 [Phycisphaerales bacterium]|nr:hypothetical protein [Phycisphaerales bacterium]